MSESKIFIDIYVSYDVPYIHSAAMFVLLHVQCAGSVFLVVSAAIRGNLRLI